MGVTANTLKAVTISTLLSGCEAFHDVSDTAESLLLWGSVGFMVFDLLDSTSEEKRRELEPDEYKILAESPKPSTGKCSDRDSIKFFAHMRSMVIDGSEKYEIVIEKVAEEIDSEGNPVMLPSAIVKYRGYMTYGDTHFVSRTDEKVALKYAEYEGRPYILTRIPEKKYGIDMIWNCWFNFAVKSEKNKEE